MGLPTPTRVRVQKTLFWLNDEKPHIAVQKPFPGQTLRVGENLEVEVVTINFDLVDPAFDQDFDILERPDRGHVHLYLDKSDFPGCLPKCIGDYNARIAPEGGTIGNFAKGTVEGIPEVASNLDILVTLNYSDHLPYPAESIDENLWEFGYYDDLLATDRIVVTLVE